MNRLTLVVCALAVTSCQGSQPSAAGPGIATASPPLAKPAAPAPLVDPAAARIDACSKDQDCVLVAESCCGCSSMGRLVAVRNDSEEHRAALKRECRDVACPKAMSDDPSCQAGAMAVCIGGTCQLSAPQRSNTPIEAIPDDPAHPR